MPLIAYRGVFHFKCEKCSDTTDVFVKEDAPQYVDYWRSQGWKIVTPKEGKPFALCPAHNGRKGK